MKVIIFLLILAASVSANADYRVFKGDELDSSHYELSKAAKRGIELSRACECEVTVKMTEITIYIQRPQTLNFSRPTARVDGTALKASDIAHYNLSINGNITKLAPEIKDPASYRLASITKNDEIKIATVDTSGLTSAYVTVKK